jgi:squalene-hopene cyclase-like protein
VESRGGAVAVQRDGALERASAFLLAQADGQFAEVRHEMTFDRAAGFTALTEKQSSDIFARATLANLFLDIAASVPKAEVAAAFRAIARREAEYLARTKLPVRTGGWSYFPDLPELPPDADSLAAAISLFARVAPEYLDLCREPADIVLSGAGADGSFETWIVGPADAPSDQARMQWAIRTFWGSGSDPDVLANLYYALWLWEPDRYAEAIRRGSSRLMEMQQPNGTWRATWYVGPAYGTALSVRLLRAAGMGDDARLRAHQFFLDTQREDGCWRDGCATPLETALSMTALSETAPQSGLSAMRRGAAALEELQLADGSWLPSPWIQMEIGRAVGTIFNVLTYQSATLTTAFCLRALLLAGS